MHRPIASLLTVVSLSCVATVSAQPAPIFTSEDVLAVRTFAGGQGVAVSSTGRWVAYALTDANDEWNVQEPRPTSHVVVQTLGADRPGAPRALTTGASHSSFPVWSPDGRRLAFIREDKFYGLDRNVQTADAVATFIRLPAQKYATPEQRVAFHTQLRDRLLAVPGITASTIASTPPFTFAGRRRLTAVDGPLASDPPPDVVTVVVEPAYFHTVVRGLVLRVARDAWARGGDREPAIRRGVPRRRESDRSSPRASAADGPTDLPERSRRPHAAGPRDHRRRVSRHSAESGGRGADRGSAVSG
ncbi:MAG: hypothetical protein DMF95_10765 [Acidobacteria bacterium]|nr:MAG: hypothetical protein DMF95_10765 [Acidobacteriota bacterium]